MHDHGDLKGMVAGGRSVGDSALIEVVVVLERQC